MSWSFFESTRGKNILASIAIIGFLISLGRVGHCIVTSDPNPNAVTNEIAESPQAQQRVAGDQQNNILEQGDIYIERIVNIDEVNIVEGQLSPPASTSTSAAAASSQTDSVSSPKAVGTPEGTPGTHKEEDLLLEISKARDSRDDAQLKRLAMRGLSLHYDDAAIKAALSMSDAERSDMLHHVATCIAPRDKRKAGQAGILINDDAQRRRTLSEIDRISETGQVPSYC